MATVRSYGATQEVTGSCHVLKVNGRKIMIDCGMFQGLEEEQNEKPFGFDPASIDVLLLTHAHLDHTGRIPKLYKEGFNGVIYATAATMELAEVILLDSAKIMNEDYQTRYKKALRRGEAKKVSKPIYDIEDVYNVFAKLEWNIVEYDEIYKIAKGVKVRFKNAGHILGSAFIEIVYKEEKKQERTIVFSGDIGNDNGIVLPKLKRCKHADYLYTESTYGDRNHQKLSLTLQEFKSVVLQTLERNGNVIIPSFAIERTQELLCILRDMFNKGELPRCEVFLDSPMATKATNIYKKYAYELVAHCRVDMQKSWNVFNFDALTYTEKPQESRRINDVKERAIIIAGSGMCNGGRILHHFKHRIWNPDNAVVFVGYQAEGTLGREIIDGAKWIDIYGEKMIVKASIHTINGFSAHADQKGLLRWITRIDGLRNIFLVHGEKEVQIDFRSVVKKRLGIRPHIVKYGEKITLV